MTDHREPLEHPDSWVDAARNYMTQSVHALLQRGLGIDRSWLDPSDPRDATVVLADTRALVWDEVTGWRIGRFGSGAQGVRTALEGAVHLGGGPLPPPAELARRVARGTAGPRREYRSYADSDGFDEVLRRY
ncbi:hypothetical protein GCM10027176_19710 [Actinoallomurus bryophytorum]|uniref:DUF6292 domain-containing protein n=1 Tax=Actinoallomurus bryophytorum TaxID=1490222 RepID=A0A543CKX3_9ACTN|nr:DUF6292 family protein [Actinoallomurus bryophytorum]TQL97751.1 hypothetical protein FB559_3354 [Actinoallomurus bryophytorum]